jgi:hypothetical protein
MTTTGGSPSTLMNAGNSTVNNSMKETTMRFPAKATKDFEIAEAGNHVAICNAIVDLGMQTGSVQYPDPKHKVYLRFELPQEIISYQKDGETVQGPLSIGQTFTASMSAKANLRKFVESWFGKPFPSDDAAAAFEFKSLLGKRCLLNVTHTEKSGKTYANIATATPLPKGMKSEEKQHNPSLFFDLENFDDDIYAKLPEWLRKKIAGRIQDVKNDPEPFNDELPPLDDDPGVPF